MVHHHVFSKFLTSSPSLIGPKFRYYECEAERLKSHGMLRDRYYERGFASGARGVLESVRL